MLSSPTRHVVVDDQDPAIQYIGPGWTTSSGSAEASFGNFGPVCDNTLHLVSNTPGSSVRWQFSGTAVWIMGSIDNTGNKPLPSWQCFLDGVLFGQTYSPGITENQLELCNATSLADGPHQLEVKVTTSGPTFYFDNMVYDPSLSVSLSGAVLLVDNTDPSINLSGSGWVNRYGNLWPLTSTGGDQMTLKFDGKSVTVRGIAPVELSGNPTTGRYTIDDSESTSFIIPGHDGLTEYNQLYFTTPDLDPGPHTLVVTHEGNSNTAPFVLDFIHVANGTPNFQASPSATKQDQASSGTISSASASASTSAPASISGGGHSTTNSSAYSYVSGEHPAVATSGVSPSVSGSAGGNPAASNSLAAEDGHSQHSMPIGAIVAGVVGGLAFILGLFLVFLYCRRRSSRRRPAGTTIFPVSEVRPSTGRMESVITPFQPDHSASYFTGRSGRGLSKIERASAPLIPTPPSNRPSTAHERASTGISASSSLPGTDAASDSARERPISALRVIRHEDSGARMRPAEGGQVIDLPPTYTAD